MKDTHLTLQKLEDRLTVVPKNGMRNLIISRSRLCRIRFHVVALSMLVLASVAMPVPSAAQLPSATLSGSITDSTGAMISNAKVDLTNLATSVHTITITNASGIFMTSNVSPGDYEVDISANGFSTSKAKVTLTVGASEVLNLTLKAGPTTETVTVTGGVPIVDATSATMHNVVNQKTLEELPLNGRDWTQLATLEPGVSAIRSQASTATGGNRANRGFGNELTDNGHRPTENTYLVDGININDYSNGAPGSVSGANPGVDAIQEFSVVTTNYTAEYGRSSGAVINAVTRSGENKVHGSVYFFDRDKIFDARNYFDGPTIPSFVRKQFGGALGGPIVKQETFVFGDYEGLRQSRSLSLSGITLSPAARSGQLSTGNVTVDPRIAPYLALWPLPNAGLTSTGDIGFYRVGALSPTNENYFTTRVDHQISGSDNIHGTYFFDHSDLTAPGDSFNTYTDEISSHRQMAAINETHVFDPAFVNNVRVGVNRVVGLSNVPFAATLPIGNDLQLGIVLGRPAPSLNVSGVSGVSNLGAATQATHHYTSVQLYDDLFITRGRHTLKFGFNTENIRYNAISIPGSPNGGFTFTSIANFLTNVPFRAALTSTQFTKELGVRDTLFGGYVQDDYRVNTRLSVSLGVRYEMLTLPKAARDPFGVINQDLWVPVPASPCSAVISSDNGPGCTVPIPTAWKSNPTTKNFDPRVGIAWDPVGNGKTAIRAAFGMFDVLPLPYTFAINDTFVVPFSLLTSVGPLGPGAFPSAISSLVANASTAGSRYIDQHPKRAYSMDWNVNVQQALNDKMSISIGYVGHHSLHNPFQQDDGNSVRPTSSPYGLVWPVNGTGQRPDPNVGAVRTVFFDSSTKYNGLLSELQIQPTRGLQAQFSYTWSKCLSDGESAGIGDPFGNSLSSLMFFAKQSRYGPCDFDLTHNFIANLLYSIPAPGDSSIAKWIGGGWQVGLIPNVSSGTRFTLVQPGDPLGQNNTDPTDYPTRLAGCNPYNSGFRHNGSLAYLNANCFVYPSAPTSFAANCSTNVTGGVHVFSSDGTQVLCPNILGNSGRNSLVGPKLVNFDASVVKTFPIKELLTAQFRFEVFNMFNHTNFEAPNNTLGDFGYAAGGPFNSVQAGSVGLMNSTATTSRQIQLAFKLNW